MEKQIDKTAKIIIWIIVFVIVFSIIAYIANTEESIDKIPAAGLVLLILAIVISVYLASKSEKIYDNAKTKIVEIKEENKIVNTVKNDLNNYSEARASFKYLSSATLLEKYSNYKENEVENMERLALEEELVERKLIDFSSMHEKMNRITDNLKG